MVCVGTPTDDVELRCVLAGPGATSLDPEEFTSVMALSTRTAAAVMRTTREERLADAELVLLPLLFNTSGFVKDAASRQSVDNAILNRLAERG